LAGNDLRSGAVARVETHEPKIRGRAAGSNPECVSDDGEKGRQFKNQQSKINNPMTEAKSTWISDQCFEAVSTSGHKIVVDGEHKSGNSPMELVLIGLCGCTGYDVVSILRKKREPFTSLEVKAEAERATSPPQVYTEIRLTYKVGGKVSHKAVEDAVRLSEEKYCSVAAMLSKTAKITYTIEYSDR
jgi:putative redox protein